MSSQTQARSDKMSHSAYALDAHQIFKSTFTDLINVDTSVANKIPRHQSVLEHAQQKVDFSVRQDIYMLSSDLDIRIKEKI